ncbi:MAG: magnesium transporter [candidate division WOR-3 bacterium]
MSDDYKFDPMVRLLKPELEEIIKNKDWKNLKELISFWQPPEIADLFREIESKERVVILRLLPKDFQQEVFSYLDSDMQEDLLRNLTNDDIKTIIEELEPDDRTELFEEMPSDLTRKMINLLSPEERKKALQLLGYPENSVGRLMNPDYIAVKNSWTIEKTIAFIRNYGKDVETINMIYVVDDQWHLLDDISIKKLILAEPSQTIDSLMDKSVIFLTANTDQEEAIKIFEKYDLVALPITDEGRHLLGIVTFDDILDAVREEQTEDFTKFSGIQSHGIDLDFITRIKDVPMMQIFKARISWLVALLIMDFVTGGIIQGFQDTIARYVVLVSFLPVLVDTAGNAGSQSATLVIRALAMGTIEMKDWFILILRELLIATLLGLVMGFGISIMGFIRGKNFLIAFIVVLSMIINVIIGSLIGVLLPFIFTKLKKDPATASTPLITSLADIIGTAIYLSIAFIFLK